MPYMDGKNADRLVQLYADMILRISYLYLKHTQDAEDVCQEVFLKLLVTDIGFDSDEHEKAWIIRTTMNVCKDHLRKAFFRRTIPLDAAKEMAAPEVPESDLLEKMMKLPENYRISLFLYYYEGYMVREIAEMLGKKPNTVSTYLARGKKKLRGIMAEDFGFEERKMS